MEPITTPYYPRNKFKPQLINQPVWQRIILLTILGYEAAGALLGGILLIAAPDGRYMKMPVAIMHGVFNSFLIPGIILVGLGILNAFTFESFKEIKEKPDEWGRSVESAIGAHLVNHSLADGFNLHYWREGNDEVDFVMEQKKVIGVEVKSGASGSKTGMSAFQKKFNPGKVLMIGDGGLPWQDFLKLNPMSLF